MKRKFRTIIACILSLSVILSVATGCGEASTDEPERTTNAEYDPLIEEVSNLAPSMDNSFSVTKKITWLSWWQIDETQAAAELFKQVYGVPEAGNADYGKDADNIFEYVYVAYADRYEKLANMISA